jgi:squalene-hopene/tetraprenyl-beta-curcumene cyclase
MPAAPLHPLTLDKAIDQATKAMLACQRDDGHWVFELEADTTIPAEYILLKHYLAEPADPVMEEKFAAYLRARQGEHGGWPLFQDGEFDMSATVKTYFALKMIGDDVGAPARWCSRAAARSTSTCSPACCSRSTAFSPGRACR